VSAGATRLTTELVTAGTASEKPAPLIVIGAIISVYAMPGAAISAEPCHPTACRNVPGDDEGTARDPVGERAGPRGDQEGVMPQEAAVNPASSGPVAEGDLLEAGP